MPTDVHRKKYIQNDTNCLSKIIGYHFVRMRRPHKSPHFNCWLLLHNNHQHKFVAETTDLWYNLSHLGSNLS
jgi:hypothetical protein